MGKIIAIANQKGGVGKTTTAINLSAALGEMGKKVLLIDCDPQCNASSGLGLDKKSNEQSIYNVLIDNISIKKVIRKLSFDNLYIAPSTIPLAGAEIELVAQEQREYRLKAAVKEIKDEFDYIFIDCPPSLGLITLNCLIAADSVLIPIQCEYFALEGVSLLTQNIKLIKKSLNPDITIEGILLTMLDSRTNLGIQVVEEIKRFFPDKVYKTIINRSVRLSEAPSFGMPVIAYDKISKGAQNYRYLALEFDARIY